MFTEPLLEPNHHEIQKSHIRFSWQHHAMINRAVAISAIELPLASADNLSECPKLSAGRGVGDVNSDAPTILFDSFGGSSFASSWRFSGYVKTVIAVHHGEVIEVLNQVEQAAAAGLYAAGFVAYEAASALNPDLPSAPPVNGLPLAWFALFRERHIVNAGAGIAASAAEVALEPQKSLEEYSGDIDRIRDYIAAGDCYQVNHTFPLRGGVPGKSAGNIRTDRRRAMGSVLRVS